MVQAVYHFLHATRRRRAPTRRSEWLDVRPRRFSRTSTYPSEDRTLGSGGNASFNAEDDEVLAAAALHQHDLPVPSGQHRDDRTGHVVASDIQAFLAAHARRF